MSYSEGALPNNCSYRETLEEGPIAISGLVTDIASAPTLCRCMHSWWLTSVQGEGKSVECSDYKGGRTSVVRRSRREEEFTQVPAPPLGSPGYESRA